MPSVPKRAAARPLPEAASAITIFVSYSHKDAGACRKLRTHLAPLEREGIEVWWDDEILGGSELDPEIRRALQRSSIFVALVSPEYLASHYCFEIEYKYALGRARRKTMHVLAAMIRPSGWKHTRMARYKALPKDGKPTTQWSNRDQAYEDIADGIRRVIKALRNPIPSTELPAPTPRRSSPRKPKTAARARGAKRPVGPKVKTRKLAPKKPTRRSVRRSSKRPGRPRSE